MRSLTLFLFLPIFRMGFAQSPRAVEEPLQKDLWRRVDSLLLTIYKNDEPGISIAIVREGKTIFKNNYGITDLKTKTNITSETNFNIGSLTKQFTALAILQLAERKKISLDDHLAKFFPGLNKKLADVITIRELLTHRSGITDHYELTDTRTMKHAHIRDVFDAIKNTDSTYFTPGTHFRYSNTAYNLLALIIEKQSRMSYSGYLKKNIFIPLAMQHTLVWSENEKIEKEASGYAFDSATNHFKNSGADENIFFSTEGDGGIYTSVDDYLKWFAALQSGKKFSNKIVKEARSAQFLIDKKGQLSYGYGWFIDASSSPAKIYHSGSNGGFRAYSFSIPDKNFLIVIFSNRDNVDLNEVVKEIYKILYPQTRLTSN